MIVARFYDKCNKHDHKVTVIEAIDSVLSGQMYEVGLNAIYVSA